MPVGFIRQSVNKQTDNMSAVTFFGMLLCINACFLQDVFGQCAPRGLAMEYGAGVGDCGCERGYNPWIGGGSRSGLVNSYGWGTPESIGAYGGAGTGDLDIAGELPVVGNTIVSGQVPILGAVQFAGEVPSAGVVTIVGRCGCDCNGSPLF